MINIDILLRLLVAHIIADFFLQTNKLCKLKKTRPCIGLSLHSLLQALCSYICVAEWTLIDNRQLPLDAKTVLYIP